MPGAEKRPDGSWRARWRTPDGKRRGKDGFTRRQAAIQYGANDEREAHARAEAAATGCDVTWGQWKMQWLRERRVEHSSEDGDLARISKWLDPRWKHIGLGDITTTDVQAWVRELETEMKPASVRKVHYLLSTSLKAAVADQGNGLSTSPCVGITMPRQPDTIGHEFTLADFQKALPHIDRPYRDAIHALPFTGMRFGEMAGLHWARVDEAAGGLDVLEVYSRAGNFIKGYPKTAKTRRLPVPTRILNLIERPDDWQRPCGIPHLSKAGKPMPCPGQLVFPGPRGAGLDHGNVRDRHWYPALELAGVERGRLHDLRHTFACWMARAGVPIGEIAAMLGHGATYMTERYAKLAPTYGEKTRVALEALGQDAGGPILDPSPKLKIISGGL